MRRDELQRILTSSGWFVERLGVRRSFVPRSGGRISVLTRTGPLSAFQGEALICRNECLVLVEEGQALAFIDWEEVALVRILPPASA